MNRSKLADLSEIFSTIAIVITLIYLAIEVTQNTDALRGQTRQAALESAQAELTILFDNPEIARSLSGDSPLSEADNIRIDNFLTIALRAREFFWLQYQDETTDEKQWSTEYAVLISLLDSDVTRLWWDRLGRHVFGEEYVGILDQTIAETPATNTIWKSTSSWASQISNGAQ